MDTIGFGDNRPDMGDDDTVMEKINDLVKKTKDIRGLTKIAAVIITESFWAETYSLEMILQKIDSALGFVPSDSIVVVGTKSNKADKE